MKNSKNPLFSSIRIVIGLLFIILGFITVANPFGLAGKMGEHILIARTEGTTIMTFAMAIFLCILEFVIGILLLTNTYKKIFISRIFMGILFMFSAFVKGVDPLGTAYKIEEYMHVFGFEWAVCFALPLSILLCTLEFLVGVLILTNTCKKPAKWLLLLMMSFFLVTTFIDALTNNVSDCGCFGDAVKLTNWQTFWKNVVLMIPSLFIFCYQNTKKETWIPSKLKDWVVLLIGAAAMISFCLYNYYNESVIDFRPWKVGNHMMPKEKEEIKSFVIYRNKQTGEKMEFPSVDLMKYYQDTVWRADWEFVDSKVIDPNEIAAPGFSMLGPDGSDHAKTLIGSPDYIFIATSYNLKDMSHKGIEELGELLEDVSEKGYHLVFLTSALPEEVDAFKTDYKGFENVDFYFADDKAIKTMIRSNPGLMLMKNGTILGKWHYRNIPDLDDIPFGKLSNKYKAD